MTFDDRLRELTDDIGRGKGGHVHAIPLAGALSIKAEHDAWHRNARSRCIRCGEVALWAVCPDLASCVGNVPLASDAMAERDEHGEVKGLYF